MISYSQAIIMGLLQGISELFPISSLGHSVILPHLLGWNINQNNPLFLNFLVATHFATAAVLFLFFFKDWVKILGGMWRSLRLRDITKGGPHGRLGWLLVTGTIPAGIVGLLLQDPLQVLFASAQAAAFFLILNGLILYGAEKLRIKAQNSRPQNESDDRISKISFSQSFKVGLSQVLSLLPGFSRSGATMAGGLLIGLNNEDAARFSFLLATPIIGAAAILKLPPLFESQNHAALGPALAGAIAAAAAAFFAVKFLLKFFKSNKLTPFAIYCVAAGVIYSLILYLR